MDRQIHLLISYLVEHLDSDVIRACRPAPERFGLRTDSTGDAAALIRRADSEARAKMRFVLGVCYSLIIFALVQYLPTGNALVNFSSAFTSCSTIFTSSGSFAPIHFQKRRTELRSGSKNSGDDTFSDRHVDKRGVTGRFSVFAEGLDPEEMSASEFRDALKEKMMERRKSSPGNKASQDYM